MLLYHYSSEPRDVIKTKRASGNATPKDLKEATESMELRGSPGLYVDHISFFIDPIPSSDLPKVFKDGHDIWHKGNVLYEHVVDIRQVETNITFSLVESPIETQWFIDSDWSAVNEQFLKEYFDARKARRINNQEMGSDVHLLIKNIKRYRGKTALYYKSAPTLEHWNSKLYASYVPHLMLYPKDGTLLPSKINKVTIGNDTRTPVTM